MIVGAHFPASRLAGRLVSMPGTSAPEVLDPVRSVIPLDDTPVIDLMTSADQSVLEVQEQLLLAAGVTAEGSRFIDRYAFSAAADSDSTHRRNAHLWLRDPGEGNRRSRFPVAWGTRASAA